LRGFERYGDFAPTIQPGAQHGGVHSADRRGQRIALTVRAKSSERKFAAARLVLFAPFFDHLTLPIYVIRDI
jgi:hypothetical protein